MQTLGNFVLGNWHSGSGKKALLVNPATEETIAEAYTEGVDFSAALEFSRTKGGPALRTMTFQERGEMLLAMSKAIHAKRDELFQLAIANGGNTRSDAKFDIDGAWGTLAAYGEIGKALGAKRVLADGDMLQLGRSARLFGAHVYVPRRGVALHINAFNFPAWGLGEKAATALLAGMPIIAKPATATALVAFRIAEILVEAKCLPEGAFQFIAGSVSGMADLMGGQDVIAFTGSSQTASILRQARGVIGAGAHLNAEADSLNASVLGPDVEADSDLMNLFLGDIVRDMTQKSGQKCTAIRRVYVPRSQIASVIENLRDRLAGFRVGNPALEEVNMGPLATANQLRDIRAGVQRLQACAKLVYGETGTVQGLGAPKDKGFFQGPVLLQCDAPTAMDAVHTHEVFGPCVTVMPYDGTAEDAARLVSYGEGGLVASIHTDDKVFAGRALLELAPFNGRLVLGTSKTASQAIPPGTVLPQLLHGGPGRAGGGEELGGERGLKLYMQRCALQGDRAYLESALA